MSHPMLPWVLLGVNALVELVLVLAVVVQRVVLRSQRAALATYRAELQKASELMAVMARDDVATKAARRAK